MYFQDLFAGWLSSAGWHVSPPSAPDPHAASTMADGLKRLKWDVFAPSTMPPPPTPTLTEVVAMARSQGCVVVLPGDPMPEPSLNAATIRLEQIGCAILLPGTMIAKATEILEGQNWTVLAPGERPPFDLAASLAGLHERHYAVNLMHVPDLGLWEPADTAKHSARTVTSVAGLTVHYLAEGERHECPVLTFWGWRKRAEATHQPVQDL